MKGGLFCLSPFLIFLFFSCVFILPARADSTHLEITLQKMQMRRGDWTGLKADVSFEFLIPEGKAAHCRGELAYQRLQEKILLKGMNDAGEILFVFKTSDRDFEIFFPKEEKSYRGNIFELQDSPNIESYLRPLDLYRALKPMIFSPESAEIESQDDEGKHLVVHSENQAASPLRRLTVTEEGDVPKEIYYSPEGKLEVNIQRFEFKTIHPAMDPKAAIVFPTEISLESPDRHITVLMTFERLKFLPDLAPEDLDYTPPEGTGTTSLNS